MILNITKLLCPLVATFIKKILYAISPKDNKQLFMTSTYIGIVFLSKYFQSSHSTLLCTCVEVKQRNSETIYTLPCWQAFNPRGTVENFEKIYVNKNAERYCKSGKKPDAACKTFYYKIWMDSWIVQPTSSWNLLISCTTEQSDRSLSIISPAIRSTPYKCCGPISEFDSKPATRPIHKLSTQQNSTSRLSLELLPRRPSTSLEEPSIVLPACGQDSHKTIAPSPQSAVAIATSPEMIKCKNNK